MVPNTDRERTTTPRTTPRLDTIRNPGRSKAVVVMLYGTIGCLRTDDGIHSARYARVMSSVALRRRRVGVTFRHASPRGLQVSYGVDGFAGLRQPEGRH